MKLETVNSTVPYGQLGTPPPKEWRTETIFASPSGNEIAGKYNNGRYCMHSSSVVIYSTTCTIKLIFCLAMSLFLQSRVFYAFEPSPVPSSVIHMQILKGAFTSHSTISAAHWAQHPMQQQQGHLRHRKISC